MISVLDHLNAALHRAMSADEAKAYGLVDEVIKSRKEVKLLDGSKPPDARLVEVPEAVLSRKG